MRSYQIEPVPGRGFRRLRLTDDRRHQTNPKLRGSRALWLVVLGTGLGVAMTLLADAAFGH